MATLIKGFMVTTDLRRKVLTMVKGDYTITNEGKRGWYVSRGNSLAVHIIQDRGDAMKFVNAKLC